MFDLEEKISGWRQQMLTAGIQSCSTLDELESHLRDQIQQQIKAGNIEQTAFEMSSQQIGRGESLQGEFIKIEKRPARKIGIFVILCSLSLLVVRFFQDYGEKPGADNRELAGLFFAGVLFIAGLYLAFFEFTLGKGREVRCWQITGIAFSLTSISISCLPAMLCMLLNESPNMLGQTLFLMAFLSSCLPLLGWQFAAIRMPVIRRRRIRTIIGIAGCLLGLGFPVLIMVGINSLDLLNDHLPNQVQLFFTMAFCFAWPMMALFGGIGYGLAEAARQETVAAVC
jgi:hypothetical protein